MTDNRYTQRTIEAHNIYSAHLSEERIVKVYLPPGYDPSQTYPVLYCHDGSEFFTHGRIATIATQLIAEGKLSPLVIAAIAVQMKTRTADYAPTGARAGAYMRFVMEECLPFVEDHYAVTRTDEGRYMAGISLGAAVSMSIYINYPGWITRYLLFSGAFYEEVQEMIRQVPSFSDLSAYMVVGRQETAVETTEMGTHDFYRANQLTRDMLAVRGAKLAYHEADGTHIWGFWQKQLPEALHWLQQDLTHSGN